jgi:hypothetical protein
MSKQELETALKARGQRAYAPFEAAKILTKIQGRPKTLVDSWIRRETGGLDPKHIKDNCGATETGTPRLHTIILMEKLAKRLPISLNFR